jgi:glycosyltransferase involved in cell wall biosynthesis
MLDGAEATQMNPLVTVVVPSYQQVRFLRKSIDSILLQEYSPIEVLVLDGGSTDGSLDVLEGYGNRIWFRSGRDGGQGSAINEGFTRSKGQILAWLNSDDFYYPGAIQKAVRALRRFPSAGLVYGHGNQVDENDVVKWLFPETVEFNLWRLVNVADYILQPTVFIRREALFSIGFLDESLNWGLDWDLWIRIGKRYPFAFVDEVLAASRLHSETKTAGGGLRRIREIRRILRRNDAKVFSPALVAHTLAAFIRSLIPSAEIMTADGVTGGMHGSFGRLSAAIIARCETIIRNWLQDAQGIWSCGLVGKHGNLWLPSNGRACRLMIRGKNLNIVGQKVVVSAYGRSIGTKLLAPEEGFRLAVDIPAGSFPVKAELTCRMTRAMERLSSDRGTRQAGFLLQSYELIV